jgi:hypothetical protein
MFIMVLFPEPLGPIIAQKLPLAKETVTPFKALTSWAPMV